MSLLIRGGGRLLSRVRGGDTFVLREGTLLRHIADRPHSKLGNALRELGRLDEAEALFKAAIADYVATLGAGNPRESNAWFGLYKTLLARGDLRGAESALSSAIAISLTAERPR